MSKSLIELRTPKNPEIYQAMSNGGEGDNRGGIDKDAAIAKTAGFVVFSGIAMSLLKTLMNRSNNNDTCSTNSCYESMMPLQGLKSPPLQVPTKPTIIQDRPVSSTRLIEIVKGDTLWGLSRKYGVSIAAIKEANGLTGDTIYAGKKLVIP